jgi:hypothetical protein
MKPDWQHIIQELRGRDLTLAYIADNCGFASRGHVHNLQKRPDSSVTWEIGDKLLKLHKRVMRRKEVT